MTKPEGAPAETKMSAGDQVQPGRLQFGRSQKRSVAGPSVTSVWISRTIIAAIALLFLLLAFASFSQYRMESATRVVSSKFGDADSVESVNGFGVFREMLEKRGCKIRSTSLLTPQLNENNVLIWFHDSRSLPQEAALKRVETWLEDSGNLVVFIGNDHDAKPAFMESVYENSKIQDRSWARVVSRMEMSREAKELYREIPLGYDDGTRYRRYDPGQGNEWFTVRAAKAGFVGHWTLEDDSEASNSLPLPAIRVKNYLEPETDNYESLATCEDGTDRLPLFYRISPLGYGGGDVIVVSSASFLSNFGTVQTANRPLVEKLLEQIPGNSRVQILESGPGNVPLSSTPEDRLVKTWSWMKHGLFPIAVLHVLAFAVIFCFARYPVFGRPKDVEFKPRNDFGLHLEEVGRLLRLRKAEDYARQKIRHYFEVVKRSLIGRGPTSRL